MLNGPVRAVIREQAIAANGAATLVGVDDPTVARHDGLVRSAFVVVSVVVFVAYPFLRGVGRGAAFAVISLAAIPAVVVGLRRVEKGRRQAWWLLLAALIVVSVGNVVRLLPGDIALPASRLLDAAGNGLALAAALALVVRRGREDLGGIIDAAIVAFAVGGVVWDVVVVPHLVPRFADTAARVDFFVVIFALSGVLGALVRLVQIGGRLVPGLWWLTVALALALFGNVILALATTPWVRTSASMMFIVTYAALALFGLDRSAPELAGSRPWPHNDALTVGRLGFLGAAVAVLPIVAGAQLLLGAHADGLLLTVGGTSIAILVMLRIGLLSTQRARAESALEHQASHDPLTGLANRRQFVAQLARELANAPNSVIAFCDLDGFKAVNDRLGHAVGDELLIEVARRLQACVRERDLVSRFGGDEFLILLRGATLHQVERIGARIVDELSQPFILRDDSATVGASLGIAVADGEHDPEVLIQRADHAMYVAKRGEPRTPGIRMVRG